MDVFWPALLAGIATFLVCTAGLIWAAKLAKLFRDAPGRGGGNPDTFSEKNLRLALVPGLALAAVLIAASFLNLNW